MRERAGASVGAYVRGRVRACAHERGGGEEGTAREEEVVGSFHRLVSFRCRRRPSRCRVGGASSSSSRAEDVVRGRSLRGGRDRGGGAREEGDGTEEGEEERGRREDAAAAGAGAPGRTCTWLGMPVRARD